MQRRMGWEVEYTDEFGVWWETLTEQEQETPQRMSSELERRGPMLPYPYSSDVRDSKHVAMRELRVQSGGKPSGYSMFSIRGEGDPINR